jgi:AcrR family transcriptional regulator
LRSIPTTNPVGPTNSAASIDDIAGTTAQVEDTHTWDGNLCQVLLDAGVALIRKVGPKSFTMREVARRAGVSHNAPYRHFRDKDELISAIVGQGFERLNDAMIGQAAAGKTGVERLELCGRAYVNFALRWPGHFTAMFASTFSNAL